MKVLIFMTQFYQLGGAERLQVELAESLNSRGVDADIVSMYSDKLPGVKKAVKELKERGIGNISFLDMQVHPSPIALLFSVVRLHRLVKQGGYDVIETSSVTPTIIASWACLRLQTRHIAGVHQVFRRDRENRLTHKLWRFSVKNNRRTLFYTISDYVRSAWIQYSSVSESRCRTINNAIADEYFDALSEREKLSEELGIDSRARVVLYVGRLAKYKGCDLLLDSIVDILNKENICLLFVGGVDSSIEGSQEMVSKMKSLLVDRRVADRVYFLGFRRDVPTLMVSADLLAHPTYMEGFGLAPMEALAAGLPVVSTSAEALPEVLAGSGSIIVSPDNIEELRSAILSALNRSEEEIKEVKAQGRAIAEMYRQRKRVDHFLDFFAEARL